MSHNQKGDIEIWVLKCGVFLVLQGWSRLRGQSAASLAINFCKRVFKFIFSQVGLSAMVVAYTIAGGFIFEHLEQTNEKQECMQVSRGMNRGKWTISWFK